MQAGQSQYGHYWGFRPCYSLGLVALFWLYEVLVRLGNQIRDEGTSPWTSLDGGPGNVLEWIDNLSSDISDRVFKGLGDHWKCGLHPDLQKHGFHAF